MSTKTIYFVRHGESEGNAGQLSQTAATPLTARGKEQAKFVAERCARLPIEFIVSSTMTRTRETVAPILEKVKKPIEYSDLFVERRKPSTVMGKRFDDPVVQKAEAEIRAHFEEPGYRHSDEENFDDLKKRAHEALEYLANLPHDNILVVTHGLFMRITLSYLFFGENLTAEQCVQFIRKLEMENTGIIVFKYDDTRPKAPWTLWTWNDHAHLG